MLADLTALLAALADIALAALGLAATWWAFTSLRAGKTDAGRYWLIITLLALIAGRVS